MYIVVAIIVIAIVIYEDRKGTNGVSTNGVTATFMLLAEGPFGYSRYPTFIFPESARANFFPNPSKFITFSQRPN